jgi:ABC-2 type transport system permease protein
MWTIAKRELRLYFSQLTGYIVVAGYLLCVSLLLWVFNTPFQLLNTELGNFNPFFELSPILFLFLIPAISMRAFSEEFATGTFELLMTKPISAHQIFGGKLIGAFIIVGVAVIPTLIHAAALQGLFQNGSQLDWAVILSSYFALFLLALLFAITCSCTSLLFQSQVASFLVGVLACFVHLYFWSFLAELTPNMQLYKWITSFGAAPHYSRMSRGVLALEDVIYFLGFSTALFLAGVELIKKKKL